MIETEKDREGWVTNLTTPGSLNLTIKRSDDSETEQRDLLFELFVHDDGLLL